MDPLIRLKFDIWGRLVKAFGGTRRPVGWYTVPEFGRFLQSSICASVESRATGGLCSRSSSTSIFGWIG